MEQAADFDFMPSQRAFGKTHMFRADRERLWVPAQLPGQFATNHVGGADEFGDEGGRRGAQVRAVGPGGLLAAAVFAVVFAIALLGVLFGSATREGMRGTPA